MKRSIRVGLPAVAALVALASATAALAAYSPSLTISRTVAASGDTTDITFTQTAADDPTATVVIYSPIGYSLTLNQANGTQIGTLDGSVVAGAFGGATVPVAGTITVGDVNSTTLQAAAQQCTGTKTHTAIWLLNVTAAGQSLPSPVPIYVDLTTTLPFSAFASASLQLCLPHPSVAAFGIKLLSATLHVKGVLAPPATQGAFRWTAVNVPWKPDTAAVNLLGTIETQAIDPTPVTATLSAKLVTKTRKVKHGKHLDLVYSYFAKVGGQVRQGNEGAAGANVDIFAGDQKIATATTNQNGSFSKTFKLTRTTGYHAAVSLKSSAVVGGSCTPPLPFGSSDMPCGTITTVGFTAESGSRTVKKPKLTHKRVH